MAGSMPSDLVRYLGGKVSLWEGLLKRFEAESLDGAKASLEGGAKNRTFTNIDLPELPTIYVLYI